MYNHQISMNNNSNLKNKIIDKYTYYKMIKITTNLWEFYKLPLLNNITYYIVLKYYLVLIELEMY